MSKFLDDLFTDLAQPENDLTEEVATENGEHAGEVEETTETADGDSEEVAEVEATPEASEEVEADDDDDTELTPAEKKAYGRLKALQDEREKRRSADEARKAAEAERDRLNAQLADMHRQRAEAAAQNLPDFHDDPNGYLAAREAQYQEQMTRQALGFSIQRAVEKYGEGEVETAAKWFEDQMATNPHIPLRQNMLSQADQMDYVVSSYKQAQKMSAITSGDYSGLIADLQKAGYNISKAEPTATAPAAPVTPTVAATTAPAPAAPAAPKRSKLATSSSATTAAPKNVSMMDAVLRRN